MSDDKILSKSKDALTLTGSHLAPYKLTVVMMSIGLLISILYVSAMLMASLIKDTAYPDLYIVLVVTLLMLFLTTYCMRQIAVYKIAFYKANKEKFRSNNRKTPISYWAMPFNFCGFTLLQVFQLNEMGLLYQDNNVTKHVVIALLFFVSGVWGWFSHKRHVKAVLGT